MRIIFMGTPEFAVPILQALVDAGHQVVAAYSQPPRRAGRGKALTPSPVHRLAESLGIEVRVPESLRDAAVQADFVALNADVAVVAAYGLLLPRAVLDAPRLGCLNVHGSLLPRWRGAAPIQRAILAGDEETGVDIMQMAAGMDTGPVRLEGRTPVARKTAGELTVELSAMGARLMLEVLADPDAYPPVVQASEGVTHAAKIDKAEARLRFEGSAADAERQVRAFNPAPGAFFEVNGERIKVLSAYVDPDGSGAEPGTVVGGALEIACTDGVLIPTHVQRAGRGVTSAEEMLRGFAIPAGTRIA
ncbi:methionyl-tRNA formyltransferase [uncultured Sphingomonas sp.]|uniref:methionyl-tRNA formyltransferase n=1 Tax=uncultured Sphingomonas sp. TaxID=158754 RepID=UPI0025D11439|nr:methionyl-tRNA formyltransferase [uncultured Sphingomonas sp.]